MARGNSMANGLGCLILRICRGARLHALRRWPVVLLLILAAVCYSQVTVGRITGSITDESGAAVAGIPVTAEEASSGVRTLTTTEENGAYAFTSLSPGTYTLTVDKQGFIGIHQTGIVLDAASS